MKENSRSRLIMALQDMEMEGYTALQIYQALQFCAAEVAFEHHLEKKDFITNAENAWEVLEEDAAEARANLD